MSNLAGLFSPLQFGRVTVKNRLECSPVDSTLGSPDGFVTREMIEWTRARARGGAGIVTVGDTGIDYEYAKTHEFGLNLGDDRVISGLFTLVEAVHRYGAKLSIELNHGGRISPPRFIGGRAPLAPSPLPSATEILVAELEGKKLDYVPTEMTQAHIDTVVGRFADAVYRCQQAGMEMVLIHGGHGHLLAQFVSPLTNKRTDRYGGSLANRARLALEVLDAVRRKVGDRVALEYRISAEELVPGGMTVEETLEFAKMIQDKIDLLHVSVGLLAEPETIPRMIQPTYVPHGINVHYAELFKKQLKVPITTVGSITFAMAQDIIAGGKADMVAMGRAFIADPDAARKVQRGEVDSVRPCIRCDTCGQLVNQSLPIRCAVNPVAGRELEFKDAARPLGQKKVVVAGGGPAGMEAARTAAGRGHEVVLFERDVRLGGALIVAAAAPLKGDMKDYLDWAVRTTMNTSGVTVKLNTEATPESIRAEMPDALVVAVGATPWLPDLPGAAGPNVFWAGDVLLGKVEAGDRVVVAGAGVTGCETALYLAGQGKKVTLVDMLSRVAEEATLNNMIALSGMLRAHDVAIKTRVKLESITGTGAVIIDGNWERTEIPCDTVVLSLGFKPRTEMVRALAGLAPAVYVVGDCGRQRGNLWHATTGGFDAAMEI
ncbi:MAG TPA: FAD-dependent oxidoreductase [Spirochaetia bacterium]|nr:FAD-dependent oxidoreductase [Spirochaetia bacterium]